MRSTKSSLMAAAAIAMLAASVPEQVRQTASWKQPKLPKPPTVTPRMVTSSRHDIDAWNEAVEAKRNARKEKQDE